MPRGSAAGPRRWAGRSSAASGAPAGRTVASGTPSSAPLPRTGRARRRLQVATAGLSVLVLVVTGYGWSAYRQLTGGLTTVDVIGNSAGAAADAVTDILLVGRDSRTDAQGHPLPADVLAALHSGPDVGEASTDTIIVVRVPAGGGAPVAFSIPRDAYVAIPDHPRGKINAAYPVAKADAAARLRAAGVTDPVQLERDSALAGRKQLIATVAGLTGVQIDHYAEINLAGFYSLTTAVGGVAVCLNHAVRDSYSGIDLPAGPQLIEGAQALAFVRQRHGLPRGDLDRARRQQMFLAAVTRKILAADTLADPGKLAALLDAVTASVVLDSGFDVLAVAQQVQAAAAGGLRSDTVPVQTINERAPDGSSIVVVDPARIQAWARASIQPASPAAAVAAPASPSPVTVEARNGSGRAGLAARVLTVLRSRGLAAAGGSVTAAPTARSQVRYPDGAQRAAAAVATALGGLAMVRDPTVAPGRVAVVLGSGYTGPDTPAAHPDSAQPTSDPAAAPAPAAQPGPSPSATASCID